MEKLKKNMDLFLQILKVIENTDFDIVLGGSTSLSLQGVDIIVHDLDIVTDKNGAIYLDDLLKEYNYLEMNYSQTEQYRSYFGIYLIDGIKVDIMGEFQYRMKDGNWSVPNHLHEIHYIEYEGEQIPVLSLEQELVEYESREKLFTIEKIQNKLEEKNNTVPKKNCIE